MVENYVGFVCNFIILFVYYLYLNKFFYGVISNRNGGFGFIYVVCGLY